MKTPADIVKAAIGFASVTALAFSFSMLQADEAPEVTHDGLHRVPDSKVALAYIDPEADFSGYDSFQILDCYVAFKKNWARDHRRISTNEQNRIKEEVASLFREVFVEVLEEKGGYPVVDEAAENVLLIRPAIVDLDITAPDQQTAGRSYSIAASAGSAKLYIELFDSESGDILARAIDSKEARDWGTMRWTTKVSNTAEAKRMIRGWAETLRDNMDEIHNVNR
jgi:hypothetical protein